MYNVGMGLGIEGYCGGRGLSVSDGCAKGVYNTCLVHPKDSRRLTEVLSTLPFVSEGTITLLLIYSLGMPCMLMIV